MRYQIEYCQPVIIHLKKRTVLSTSGIDLLQVPLLKRRSD